MICTLLAQWIVKAVKQTVSVGNQLIGAFIPLLRSARWTAEYVFFPCLV